MTNTFKTRFSELRKNEDITQNKLAKELGTTQATLSSYENGTRPPSSEFLIAVSKRYKVSVDWLLGLSNKKEINKHIETYQDLFKMLVELCSVTYPDTQHSDEETTDKSHILKINNYTEDADVPEKTTLVTLEDINIKHFFQKWTPIYSAYEQGVVTKKNYDDYLEKLYNKYDIPIKNTSFEEGEIVELFNLLLSEPDKKNNPIQINNFEFSSKNPSEAIKRYFAYRKLLNNTISTDSSKNHLFDLVILDKLLENFKAEHNKKESDNKKE